MAYNTKAILVDVNGKPIPQYFNAQQDQYEVLLGQDGAARAILYGPDGQPIGTAGNPLQVKAHDTDTVLGQIKDALGPLATETKLEAVRTLLASLVGKDFATQTTLAQVKQVLDTLNIAVEDLKSELILVKANQLSGDQKVQLSGNIALQYKYSIISRTGGRQFFGVSGVKLLHNGPMTFWLKNNYNLPTRNNVQLHWYTGDNQIIPPTILPDIPVGATLGVVVGGYPIRAEDTSELIWVPNPGAHLVRISWDIRSDATGVGMEALCTYYSPEEVD